MTDQQDTQEEPGSVCAVVVTYNRKALLRECLHALLAQTHPVTTITVVNNVSTDGTLEMLTTEFPPERFPQIEVLTLPKNVGGAGGFHEGMKQAAALGYDWVWLMDDDTIVAANALAELFSARGRFPKDRRPDILGSKVVWTDGTLHPMNISWADQRDPEQRFLAAEHRTFPLRTATFVSLLLHRRFVEQYGLPIADYFIWADDVEYSARLLKENFGVAVPDSVVTHKTPQKHGTTDVSPRFYYHVRNTIWLLTRSSAFSTREKLKLWVGFSASLGQYLKRSSYSLRGLSIIGRGIRDGATRAPAR